MPPPPPPPGSPPSQNRVVAAPEAVDHAAALRAAGAALEVPCKSSPGPPIDLEGQRQFQLDAYKALGWGSPIGAPWDME